jgi:ABC-type multidrug transport system fused ATPase/permease subunit
VQGAGAAIVLWSVLGALAAAALLIALTVLIDVLAGGGSANLSADDAAQYGDLQELGVQAETARDGTVHAVNAGLLPTAVRYADRFVHGWLLAAWHSFPAFRDNLGTVSVLILVIAVLGLLRIVTLSRSRALGTRAALHIAAQLRTGIHRQALRLGPSDLEGNEQQQAVDLFTDDVDRIRDGVSAWITRLPSEAILACLLLLLAFLIDWRLTLQCLLPLGIAWWMADYERTRARPARALAEPRAATELRPLADGLRKPRLVRGYHMESFEHEHFRKHLDRFTQRIAAGREREIWALWIARLCAVICVAVVLYFVSARVLSPDRPLPFSSAALLLAIFARLTPVWQTIRDLAAARLAVNVSGDKVQRYLNEIPEVGQAVGAKFLEPVTKSIIFEAVSYRRGDRVFLQDFDLRLPARTTIGLVSLDSLSARAAAFLLPRFIEPHKGRVLFDGEDTAWATLESLRAETIYVGGGDPCFTGTVLENITGGDARFSVQDATDAAKLVHAHNFILRMPQGYETVLGEHGEQLDAGQAFRLGLARAVLRNPAVLIVEEPAAPMDEDTKALLDDAYNRLVKGRTVIFLPGRLSTVRRCEQVALLQDGKVVAIGPHDKLIRESELYRHWEYVTFNAFRQREGRTAGRA